MSKNVSKSTTGSRQNMLSVVIRDKAVLHQSYMPFVKNGGLFIPTKKTYSLGNDVFVLLTLMEEQEKIPFAGRVVWITPDGAQGNRPAGIGVQFHNDSSGKAVRDKIENYLAGALKSDLPTHTM